MADVESLVAFLARILPRDGVKCAFELATERQFFTASLDELAGHILQTDARGSDIYFGCAAFKQKGSRKRDNVSGAQCFWLDVDAGEGKPYRDQREGAGAVLTFCDQLQLPVPMFVRSGNGIHVYWPFDRLLLPDEWRAGALRLKLACRAHGLKADESRTTDITSILRPPGTHNRKVPHEPRLVQVGPLVGPYDADAFLARLGNGTSPAAPDRGRRISGMLLNYSPPAYSEAEEARLRSALSFIPAEDYVGWRDVGMALHSTGWGERARCLWDEHSRTWPTKYSDDAQQRAWDSFDRPYIGRRITVATIFHMAKERGWTEDGHAGNAGVVLPMRKDVASPSAAHSWTDHVFSAAELRRMTFEEVRWVLPPFIPEGVALLVGRPKIGKSWLALDICLACAGDRSALGCTKPAQGDVLYLALEDGKRRLQTRLDKLMPTTFGGEWPPRLKLVPMGGWQRADQGGLDDIDAWCRSVPNPTLIVVDTLERFREPANGKAPLYSTDYKAITGLQKIATAYGIAIVVLHHDRKSDADDAFDTVSGTLGLTGAADTILIMKRREGVVLHARGRDIEESETAMQFEKATCRWRTVLGAASDVYRSQERARVISALKSAGRPLSISEIKSDAEMRSRGATDTLLSKMVRDGQIVRAGKGRYDLSDESAGKIGQKERSNGQATDFTDKTSVLSDLTDLTGLDERKDGRQSEHIKQ